MLRKLLVPLLTAVLAVPSGATWSILVVDRRTGEVAIGAATCIPNTDLLRALTAIDVGKGVGVIQASGDPTLLPVIFAGLEAGDDPADILDVVLAAASNPGQHQIGIVALEGGAPVTFSGNRTMAARGGTVGEVGDLAFAIQGNILTGSKVWQEARRALLETPGDLGQKLMAAMEAARAFGGDGRCSCPNGAATACGAPPPEFEKAAHCGFVVVARVGDQNSACNRATNCARGSYYLRLNVGITESRPTSPDPVFQLQEQYDAWRAQRVGRPDGILSRVESVDSLPADGTTERTVTVRLVDIDGTPLSSGGATVEVASVGGGPSLATVGEVTDLGDGSYSFPLTAGTQAGVDRFEITADDGFVKATLYPYLEVRHDERAPLHAGFDAISATRGANVPFVVDVASKPRGHYLILGTLSGTTPGLRRGRLTLPLNPDAFTHTTLVRADDPALLPGTRGKLDRAGRAEGGFVEPPRELMLALVGRRVDWAALVLGKGPPLATNAVGFDIVP